MNGPAAVSSIPFTVYYLPFSAKGQFLFTYHRVSPSLCPLSFPNDLDQHPLASALVELSEKDLLPGAKIQLPPACPGPGRHRVIATTASRPITWRLPQHENLGHDVGIGIVLAGIVAEGDIGRSARAGPVFPASGRNPGWKRLDSSSLMKIELVLRCEDTDKRSRVFYSFRPTGFARRWLIKISHED